MAESNVEIVRRGYEALNSGDLEAMFALFDPEVEVLMAEEPGEVMLLDLDRTYRGIEGFGRFLQAMSETWGEFEWVPEDFLDAGENVVVLLRLKARGKGSGVEVDQPMAHLCTMRHGKLIRHETFFKRAHALRAAGIE